MTPWTRVLNLLVAVGCGWVVIASPSEIGALGIGLVVGPTLATITLATISAALFVVTFTPARFAIVAHALCTAAVLLAGYGFYAWGAKGSIALPTAALALYVAGRSLEIATELRVAAGRDHLTAPWHAWRLS